MFGASQASQAALDAAGRVVDTPAGPFQAAALAIDEIHEQDDPLAAFSMWQRSRLAAWRKTGNMADSPVIWASLSNYHAPDRTIRSPGHVLDWMDAEPE